MRAWILLGIVISFSASARDPSPEAQRALNRLDDMREQLGMERTKATRTNKVYRCVKNGETVFSQQPCSDSAEVVDVKSSKGNYRKSRFVYIGMTRDAVLNTMGKPNKINRTTRATGVFEQWVYRDRWSKETRYVYLDDGVVVSHSD